MPAFSARIRIVSATLAIVLAAGFMPPARAAAAWRFDIDKQSLATALAAFARQSGLQLVYYSELANRQLSPALKGSYTAEDALAILLEGSNLAFALLDERTVVIEPAAPGESASVTPREPATVASRPPALPLIPRAAAEEVLVTARRREENAQLVPIAVSVFSSDRLTSQNVDNTEGLNRQLPNVSVAGGSFFGRQNGVFRMRGIPGVAVYVDGIVQGGGAGALQNVIELERIEVLRGPQGTLFGKNAVGGALQYLSQQPRETFGGRIRTTAGAYDRFDIVANVDVPVSPQLLTKVTAARLTRDGYLPSTTIERDFGSQSDTLGRVVVAWKPAAALRILGFGERITQKSNGNPSTVWSLNPVCVGGPLPENYLGGVPNNPCVYAAVGLALPQQWIYGARSEWRTASDYSGPDLNTDSASVKLDATLDVAPGWSLRGLAGHRQVESAGYADFDGTPYRLFDGMNYNERRERSLEVQLVRATTRLRGTMGLYFYEDHTRGRRMNWIANDLYPSVDPARFAAAQAYFPLFGTPGNAGAAVVDGLTHGSSEGWALFGEWTYALTSRLSVSAGARYNEDTIRTAAYPTVDTLNPRCCTPSFHLDAGGPAIPNQSGSATFTEVSPRLSLQYQWRPELMAYFTYSEGFGAGGFTGGNIPDQPNGGFAAFGPEVLANYELGLRSGLFGGRLRFNLSAFFGEYGDIQVSEEVVPRFPTTTNAGKAEIRGLEIEGIWSPLENLSFNYGIARLETHYTDLGRVTNIRLDSPFAYAPRYSYAVGAQYVWQDRKGGRFTLRGDYGWQDDVIATLDINTGSSIPAYGLASARLAYQPSARWDIALAGTNLFNEYYRINGFFIPADQIDNGTLGRPREWALTVGFSFD